jgi:hypothetical protein
MYEAHTKVEGDNPTVGLILCSDKNAAIARYSVLSDSQQLFAAKYQFTLPSEEALQREILRERALIENNLNRDWCERSRRHWPGFDRFLVLPTPDRGAEDFLASDANHVRDDVRQSDVHLVRRFLKPVHTWRRPGRAAARPAGATARAAHILGFNLSDYDQPR